MRRSGWLLGLFVSLATSHHVFARDSDTPAQAQNAAAVGQAMIAGRAVSCKDIRGVAVTTMQVANLGDVGRAGIINRVPIIAIDPDIIRRLPDKLQLFFYQHECAHHVLGHWFQMSLSMETDADCWAIRHGRDNGVFSRDDVMSFAPFLAKSGGSPFGHLPGPARAKQLLKCFDTE
jgi:hypothetical protein